MSSKCLKLFSKFDSRFQSKLGMMSLSSRFRSSSL